MLTHGTYPGPVKRHPPQIVLKQKYGFDPLSTGECLYYENSLEKLLEAGVLESPDPTSDLSNATNLVIFFTHL